MENPASWGKLERVIHDALCEYDAEQERGVIGASRAAVVASALRREGIVQEGASRNSASGSGAVNSEVRDGVLYPDILKAFIAGGVGATLGLLVGVVLALGIKSLFEMLFS